MNNSPSCPIAAAPTFAHDAFEPFRPAARVSPCLVSMIGSLLLGSGTVFAQAGRPAASLEQAHVSSTLYFEDAAAEAASRQTVHAQVKPLAKAIAASSPGALLSELSKAEMVLVALQRHAAYLKIQILENTQEQTLKDAYKGIAADQSAVETAIDSRLRQVREDQIHLLGPYAFLATGLAKDARHALSPEAQVYREAVTLPHEQAIARVRLQRAKEKASRSERQSLVHFAHVSASTPN